MTNPLSHVGQSPHPEVSAQTQRQCEQAQAPAPGETQAEPSKEPSQGPSKPPGEHPATRLSQHPLPLADEAQPSAMRPEGESDTHDGERRHESAM